MLQAQVSQQSFEACLGERQSLSLTWTNAMIRQHVQNQPASFQLADGRVMSFVLWQNHPGVLEVYWLETLPQYRRQGTMARHLSRLFQQFSEKRIWLEVRAGNKAARRLYNSLGFTQVGQRKAYYRDGDDALLLHRPPQTLSVVLGV